MNEIKEYTTKLFEDIKHIDEEGNEFWLARELQVVFEYTQWRRFNETVERAIISCNNSDINAFDHFANVGKIVKAGATTKKVDDYKLSRYACYLIAQTDAKLKRDNVDNEYTANAIHYEVGKEVRSSIERLGGTMPEDLLTPDRSLKELEKEVKK